MFETNRNVLNKKTTPRFSIIVYIITIIVIINLLLKILEKRENIGKKNK